MMTKILGFSSKKGPLCPISYRNNCNLIISMCTYSFDIYFKNLEYIKVYLYIQEFNYILFRAY
jgi:hypothetical protein